MPIIGTVVLVSKENKLRESKHREKIYVQNYALQRKHYLALYEKEEQTRKFRHDMKKQLEVCQNLLKQDKVDELMEYLESIMGRMKGIETSIAFKTGSDFIDASLNELLSDEAYANVRFNDNWVIPSNLVIEPIDMTSLFMNLLENAFEAAVKCENEAFVRVKINAKGHLFYLAVENSYNGDLKFENEKLQTIKSNQGEHGYGVQIIKDIVHKYHGDMKVDFDGEKFKVEITFGKEIYVK